MKRPFEQGDGPGEIPLAEMETTHPVLRDDLIVVAVEALD
jgi:hypothetical protein